MAPQPPPGAYAPGTKLIVGTHNVEITQYISQGGFAHVYTCEIDPPFNNSRVACLKRVAVPSKWQLTLLRQEVDAMRRLRGNKYIVSYIDSHAARLPPSGMEPAETSQQYEVFMLMEFCENNGLIEFMNTRLSHKLTEPEILDISRQICIGVAMCHNLEPPLIHRDIKIENILIDRNRVFKLCDFGSAIPYVAPPTTAEEANLIKQDALQYTTPQYRAPEMIEVSADYPINDKLDIWALGCLIYKLCYYTTPFELPQQVSYHDLERAILGAESTLRFKDQPGLNFSPRLKNLIRCCLRRDPRRRPNIVQLVAEIDSMRGTVSTEPSELIPHSVVEARMHAPAATKSQLSFSDAADEMPGPRLPRRRHDEMTSRASSDPFASIDKSKLLRTLPRPKSVVEIPQLSAKENRPRPRSQYFETRSNSSDRIPSRDMASTIKSLVQLELKRSPSEQMIAPQSSGTMEFLRSREEIRASSRHNTGGSFSSVKETIRRISTGNSVNEEAAGINQHSTGHKRTSSVRSLKKILTGNKSLNQKSAHPAHKPSSLNQKPTALTHKHIQQDLKPTVLGHEPIRLDSKSASVLDPVLASPHAPKKISIQARLHLLMTHETKTLHRATGYGKYTDDHVLDDISAINYTPATKDAPTKVSTASHKPSPSPETKFERKVIVKEKPLHQHKIRDASAKRTPPPKVPSKKAPPKPQKPIYLKAHNLADRFASDGSDTIPDLDDLEKRFSRRFPSFV